MAISPAADRGTLPALASHSRSPSSPPSVNTLTHVIIAQAILESQDLGATLDFGHKALTDVGEFGAEELAGIGREQNPQDESSVLRINLGNNKLSTLPMAFALLSSLRYLNLRSNSFSSFPDVLTIMPSLEILEIGRNKIKRFPSQPGRLLNLRVFSFSKNKITRLPTYFSKFSLLEVLHCDQNPIEWPPRSIMEAPFPDMPGYIHMLQRWIEDNAGPSDRRVPEDSVLTPLSSTVADGPTYDALAKSPLLEDEDGRTPHARSFSVSSNASAYNNEAMPPLPRHAPSSSTASTSSRHKPLHLTLPNSASSSTSPSPSRSPSDFYLPTPDDSVSSTDEELYRDISASLGHIRGMSYSELAQEPLHPSVLIKKSLPELRPPARLRTTDDFSRFPPLVESPILGDFDTFTRRNNRSLDNVGLPSPVSNRQDSAESDASFSIARPPRHFPRELSISISASGSPIERPAPPMDVERNSYFRRFSTIQPSSLTKTIPEPLLRLVDAVRGILFAVSQIYQALQHYTVYAIDDRLASILLKVLDPASAYMTQLINALDRFDSMSRRTVPTPAVCRAVIESCRDNVVAFGKAVGVLGLQLKVLATRDDDRYTRQMLLVLYGASAEISNAWQSAIVPNMSAVEPLLRDLRPAQVKKRSVPTPSTDTNPLAPPKPPFAAVGQRVGLRSPDSPAQRHIARRHAGSFSYKDVEIGKAMPSMPVTGTLRAGLAVAAEIPTPRAALRQASYFSPRGATSHSRQESQSSTNTSSASSGGSGPSTPNRIAVTIPETPTDLSTLVDKEAIDAMAKAVSAAPPIWISIARLLEDDDRGKAEDELRSLLGRAEGATAQLSEEIANLRAGLDVDRKEMRETAHLFVKIVVQITVALKQHGHAHPLSASLRNAVVKLTNATEEFVILLHVSSFSSPRPYTPVTPLTAFDDTPRLSPSLTRSRPTLQVPRPALSGQSFKIPAPSQRRLATNDPIVVP